MLLKRKLKEIREKVSWQSSLDHDIEIYGENTASRNLLTLYRFCYWEYPDFTPTLFIRRWRKDQLPGDGSDRGLSNTNKVHEVVIRNNKTGEKITINKVKARLSKMRRRIFSWADTLKEYLEDIEKYRKVMITLTYQYVDDWKPNHIRDFIKALKKKIRGKFNCLCLDCRIAKAGSSSLSHHFGMQKRHENTKTG